MQVKIAFDTETESVDNLVKLIDAIQKLVDHKTGTTSAPRQTAQPIQAQQKSQKQKTSGGCRVIPYEDMSDKMANIFSGRKY